MHPKLKSHEKNLPYPAGTRQHGPLPICICSSALSSKKQGGICTHRLLPEQLNASSPACRSLPGLGTSWSTAMAWAFLRHNRIKSSSPRKVVWTECVSWAHTSWQPTHSARVNLRHDPKGAFPVGFWLILMRVTGKHRHTDYVALNSEPVNCRHLWERMVWLVSSMCPC